MSFHDRRPPNTTVDTVPSAIMHACSHSNRPLTLANGPRRNRLVRYEGNVLLHDCRICTVWHEPTLIILGHDSMFSYSDEDDSNCARRAVVVVSGPIA